MFVELVLESGRGSFRSRIATSLLGAKALLVAGFCKHIAPLERTHFVGEFYKHVAPIGAKNVESRCLTAIAVGSKLLPCNFGRG